MSARGSHDRVIARLPDKDRRAILDACCSRTGRAVLVEVSSSRKLSEATRIVGFLKGTAFAPSAACADVLIVEPLAEGYRTHTLSAAHVLRISHLTLADEGPAPELDAFGVAYRRGEVLAGPPV